MRTGQENYSSLSIYDLARTLHVTSLNRACIRSFIRFSFSGKVFIKCLQRVRHRDHVVFSPSSRRGIGAQIHTFSGQGHKQGALPRSKSKPLGPQGTEAAFRGLKMWTWFPSTPERGAASIFPVSVPPLKGFSLSALKQAAILFHNAKSSMTGIIW